MKYILPSLLMGFMFLGASSASASTPLSPSYTCPQLTVQLSIGSTDARTGGQVSQLQNALAARYGNQLITGYFGLMTRANVVRFQQETGLPPVGIVGPLTRAALAKCSGGVPSAMFQASPATGSAPLTTTFSVNSISNGIDISTVYVDFGDGEQAPIHGIYCFAAPCSPVASVSHTYKTQGTYSAKLMQNNNYCAPGMYCTLMYREPTVLATAIVVVNGSTSTPTPSISGVGGPTQLLVGQSGTWQLTVQNPSSYLSYSVVWGDETSSPYYLGVAPATQTSTGTLTHTYQRAGIFYPKFTVTDQNGVSTSASVSVLVQ